MNVGGLRSWIVPCMLALGLWAGMPYTGRGQSAGAAAAGADEGAGKGKLTGPAMLSVVIEEEREKSSVKPPANFDEATVVANLARFAGMQNPAEQKLNPVKVVQDAYAKMAKDELFKDLPSAMAPPLSGSSGHPCHYFVYLPDGYGAKGSETNRWPLLIFLHGAGGNMKLGPWSIIPTVRKERHVAIFPSYLNGMWWTPSGGKFLGKVLADAYRRYPIDRTRVTIMGVSNGATGAWAISKANPREFQGVISVSGAFDRQGNMVAPVKGPPVYIVSGAHDQVIDVRLSRGAYKALKRNRPATVYKEYEDFGHLVFFVKGEEIMSEAFEWLKKLPPTSGK